MRCYNGCPDSELKALLDARAAARVELEKKIPGARCVYFPSPGFFQVWLNNKPISKDHWDSIYAINEAITNHG